MEMWLDWIGGFVVMGEGEGEGKGEGEGERGVDGGWEVLCFVQRVGDVNTI